MDPVTTLALVTLVIEKGAPLAIRLIQTMDKDTEPTVEDIQKLKDIKDPEEYFKK